MKLIDRLRGSLTLADYAEQFQFAGNTYPLAQSWASATQETVAPDFRAVVAGAYQANGVVFAVEQARLGLFTEGRFTFRELSDDGRPGALKGGAGLDLLRNPWPGGTTGDLLARMLQDADFAGNSFTAKRGEGRSAQLRRLRPDGVTIVKGSKTDSPIDAEVIGYLYRDPFGPGEQEVLLPEEVAHFAPTPDPLASYRGMPWLAPVIREAQADSAMREHKIKFLENGARPGLAVSFDASVGADAANSFIDRFEATHSGYTNSYKTLFFGMGATPHNIGGNLDQIDFKNVQAAGENRIAMAGGVPAIILGSESGIAHAAYANYFLAMRRFADGVMRGLWRNAAESLAHLVDVPANSELWIDDRDIAWLRQDQQDVAEIGQVKATTIGSYIKDGFTAASAVAAVQANDPDLLEHTGRVSVQLYDPTVDPGAETAPPAVPDGPPPAA